MARIRRLAAIATGVLVVAGVTPAVATARGSATGPVARPVAVPGVHSATVRLMTGDRVTVTTLPDGRRTASAQPGPGREHVPFETFQGNDKSLTVIPFDAQGLVSAGTLDRRLFNVTGLISQGYDEAHTSALPLIVSSQPVPSRVGARVSAQASKAAGSLADRLVALEPAHSRTLASIDARSLKVPGKDLGPFWKTLTSGEKSAATRAAVTPRISLDGKVKAMLDRSTAQINAPTAWKAGYEGQGVKVAILDSGVDATHPDLAGRIAEAKDFSGSGSTVDHFGHGTHVASIVGGTGAASGGTRRGVAPKADLLIGKVLGDNGSGLESGIIDGMEWAAGEHAKVVNMSLGADEQTDGTDPLSQAVDNLTASTGTLFVVAAGNSGPGQYTVGTPGAAESALTVGAVDRDDSLAPFSSRGPRFGDGAVKPDVTAPGVGIVAARAAGTTLGDPIDDNYVSLSGTSMATPHVAGAAALLAQQHPDWSAQQLKDALISTAHTVPGTKVTEQGGGRIDLATAIGPITATGSLTLAPLMIGGAQGQEQTATIHYTNTGDHPLTLSLAANLATETGRALPDGVLSLDSNTVQLAPGATADLPLRTDATHAVRGQYYGYVTAKSADGTVLAHTTLSLGVHAPKHRLTVIYRDRSGQIAQPNQWVGPPKIWGPDGFVGYTDRQAMVADVEEGTYLLETPFATPFADLPEDGTHEDGMVTIPEVKVTKDTTVTVDLSKATEVKVRTPRPAERYGWLASMYDRQIDGQEMSLGMMSWNGDRFYTNATAPVTDGTFEFAVRTQMRAPQLRAKVSGISQEFTPYYEGFSPVFGDRGARLTAVAAGTAAAPDFRGARGKLAVVQDDNSAGYDQRALAQAAAAAGAKALLVVWPKRFAPYTEWRPKGDRMALPYVRASWTDGTALLKRMAMGTTTVEFSGTMRSPYMYDLMEVSKGSIPKTVYTVSERNTAEVHSTYTRTGASTWASEQRFAWRPYQEFAWNQFSRYVPVGQERTEYVSAGDGTQWQHAVQYRVVDDLGDQLLQGGMHDDPHTYQSGQHATERWFGAVVRPSIPPGKHLPSVRNGNTLSVYVPEFNDSGAVHWSFAEAASFESAGDTATAELYRNGEQIATSNNGAWGNFEVPAGNAEYRMDLTTARTSDDWHFATGTHTSWTFHSDTTADATLLPLLQLDYDVPVDAQNAVGPARTDTLGLTVRNQDGMAAPRGVRLKVEASYDDGKTWTTTRTAQQHGDGQFTAAVERPSSVHGDAYVTLRVTATDDAGNSVQQTVKRAYLHRGAE
ncbi:S8 family serine peptidase [Streptomyces mirabilis]|uniref:S8 family serine peptidase n=1 Tax=Streptomyces mirabilis TaxID=68239 RepID=UPI0036C2EC2F